MKFCLYNKSNLNSNSNVDNLYKKKNYYRTQKEKRKKRLTLKKEKEKKTLIRLRKKEKERERFLLEPSLPSSKS